MSRSALIANFTSNSNPPALLRGVKFAFRESYKSVRKRLVGGFYERSSGREKRYTPVEEFALSFAFGKTRKRIPYIYKEVPTFFFFFVCVLVFLLLSFYSFISCSIFIFIALRFFICHPSRFSRLKFSALRR